MWIQENQGTKFRSSNIHLAATLAYTNTTEQTDRQCTQLFSKYAVVWCVHFHMLNSYTNSTVAYIHVISAWTFNSFTWGHITPTNQQCMNYKKQCRLTPSSFSMLHAEMWEWYRMADRTVFVGHPSLKFFDDFIASHGSTCSSNLFIPGSDIFLVQHWKLGGTRGSVYTKLEAISLDPRLLF